MSGVLAGWSDHSPTFTRHWTLHTYICVCVFTECETEQSAGSVHTLKKKKKKSKLCCFLETKKKPNTVVERPKTIRLHTNTWFSTFTTTSIKYSLNVSLISASNILQHHKMIPGNDVITAKFRSSQINNLEDVKNPSQKPNIAFVIYVLWLMIQEIS